MGQLIGVQVRDLITPAVVVRDVRNAAGNAASSRERRAIDNVRGIRVLGVNVHPYIRGGAADNRGVLNHPCRGRGAIGAGIKTPNEQRHLRAEPPGVRWDAGLGPKIVVLLVGYAAGGSAGGCAGPDDVPVIGIDEAFALTGDKRVDLKQTLGTLDVEPGATHRAGHGHQPIVQSVLPDLAALGENVPFDETSHNSPGVPILVDVLKGQERGLGDVINGDAATAGEPQPVGVGALSVNIGNWSGHGFFALEFLFQENPTASNAETKCPRNFHWLRGLLAQKQLSPPRTVRTCAMA